MYRDCEHLHFIIARSTDGGLMYRHCEHLHRPIATPTTTLGMDELLFYEHDCKELASLCKDTSSFYDCNRKFNTTTSATDKSQPRGYVWTHCYSTNTIAKANTATTVFQPAHPTWRPRDSIERDHRQRSCVLKYRTIFNNWL